MTAARDAAAAVIGLGGIGDPFFCSVAIEEPEVGSDPGEVAASLLAAAEARFGPVTSLEARRRERWLLVQAAHAAGAVVTQLMIRLSSGPGAAVDLDGKLGSLRLERDGRLLRHVSGAAEELPAPTATPGPAHAGIERARSALRDALTGAEPTIA